MNFSLKCSLFDHLTVMNIVWQRGLASFIYWQVLLGCRLDEEILVMYDLCNDNVNNSYPLKCLRIVKAE